MRRATDLASASLEALAQGEQRKLERLFALIFLVGGVTSTIASLFDSGDGLFTPWDDYGTAITSVLYLAAGALIYLRPKWLTLAVLVPMVATAIYQQGVMVMAVHHPNVASLYSAGSSGAFFPLLYVALFIILPRGAARYSWINCAGFYLQFVVNTFWFADPSPSPERLQAEHFLVEAMMAHPIYIVALSYIVRLRERLNAVQQEAFKTKERFIGILSHEIRNQLQTMVGSIDLLDLKLTDPGQRRSVTRLQRATTQLQTYLRDVNELTMLEDPTLRIEKSRFDLTALLDELRDEWLPQARHYGLLIKVESPLVAHGQALLIETDQARLHQILANLLSNALKYTDTGSVTIAAAINPASPGSVTLSVSDTGIGIEQESLARVFLPYVRLENALSFCAPGSGLGLAIVERLVQSLGGTLNVESVVDQGSTFSVTIPGVIGR